MEITGISISHNDLSACIPTKTPRDFMIGVHTDGKAGSQSEIDRFLWGLASSGYIYELLNITYSASRSVQCPPLQKEASDLFEKISKDKRVFEHKHGIEVRNKND